MSPYQHLPLPSEGDHIRLLCLLPNENEAEPLQCKLHNYSLQKLGPRTHRYEAISYAWGDPSKTLPIYFDEDQCLITANLHAALRRLRDHSFERIIWADAVCINQKNLKERGHQVQLMARIYSNAHRVIVWLGDEIEGTDDALEDIRLAANRKLTKRSEKDINQEVILGLLQRPWFQRIWVLQEVAAARHVVIMCGSAEIDGYAFCLGINSLLQSNQLSYEAHPELQSLPSLMNLIEQAGLRPKHIKKSQEAYSLEIRSLAELVDMFYTRQASDARDKIYALLGMSLDDPGSAGLLPNYNISWEELVTQLVEFVLSKDASVQISGQRMKIKSKGCILGQVDSVRRDDGQNVNITINWLARGCNGTARWTLQASAKPIQARDILCLQYGASKPMIIRVCEDHFTVIVLAATPVKERSSFKCLAQVSRDFLLFWDWENFQGTLKDQEEYNDSDYSDYLSTPPAQIEYETSIKKFSQALKYSEADFEDSLGEVAGLWNDMMILDDLREYREADKKFSEIRSAYLTAFGKEYPPRLINKYGQTLLPFAVRGGQEDIAKLLLITGDPDVDDGRSRQTPLYWAARNGQEAIIKLLLETGKVKVDSKDEDGWTPLCWAAKDGHEAVIKLLLETGKVEINSKDKDGRTPLCWAAEDGHEAVIKLLFKTGKVKVDSKDRYGQTPLCMAAENGHEAVVKLLLETGKIEVDSADIYSRTPLSRAAENGHEAVVKLLLETGKVEVDSKDGNGRPPLCRAAKNGHEAVVKLLLETGKVKVDLKDGYGQTPLWWAAENGHEAVVKLLLETGKVEVDSKDRYDQTPLCRAAENGHEAAVKLLLETGKVKVDSKDGYGQTPLWWAAENGHEAIVRLLLGAGGVGVDSGGGHGRALLWWAAKNGHEAIVKVLSDLYHDGRLR